MALTVKRLINPISVGSVFMAAVEATGDSSYAEGGEALTPADFGLQYIEHAVPVVKNGSEAEATTVGSAWYDKAKSLLRFNDYKTQKELAKEKDIGKVIVEVTAFGKARAK